MKRGFQHIEIESNMLSNDLKYVQRGVNHLRERLEERNEPLSDDKKLPLCSTASETVVAIERLMNHLK